MNPLDAYDEWRGTDEGQSCECPYDFTQPGHQEFLISRLWRAFFAGVKAGRQSEQAAIEARVLAMLRGDGHAD